ncbi:hypothetical protein [Streptomyces sp. TBY4]|uniref:hypothetical protein n=1 Tax=Streptomyces sp. TBY4 TaxID=2962030 RepID=UPI0020B731EE|nr:hypothetical protein [Streptomyces sp. TBY4]MCP3754049.1 hypothetical protein [Streptomyces sp. TBY4]
MAIASDPYQGHGFPALFTIAFVGAALLVSLLVYLGSRLSRKHVRGGTPATACRDLSLTAAAGALAMYLWGCLHLLFVERQERGVECAKVQGVAEGPGAEAITGDFIPLQLVCHMPGGRTHTVLVPDYINPSVAVLLALALTAAVTSVALGRKQNTAQRKEG